MTAPIDIDELRQKAKKALDRVQVFNDSEEVAYGVNQIDEYWSREACVHIQGLWQLTKQLRLLLSRALRHIKDLEAQLAENEKAMAKANE